MVEFPWFKNESNGDIIHFFIKYFRSIQEAPKRFKRRVEKSSV